MAAWVCVGCTTVYSVRAPRCPHCGSTDHVEQGEPMPKITVHEGPSIAGVTGAWSDTDAPDAWPAQQAQEEGDGSSPGTSSSTSPETPQSAPEPSETPSPKRARTTASRSGKARTDKGSTARGTAGDPGTDTSATGSADK